MKFIFAASLALISIAVYSQVPVDATEGAYASYQKFAEGSVALGVDSIEKHLQKNIGGNVLTFPMTGYDDMWGVFYKGHLFLRGDNVRSNELPLGVAPVGTHLIVTSKWDAAFARVIRFGKICLTSENKLVKLPGSRDYEFSIFSFRKLIRDDAELVIKFNREQDKRLSIYKYIDLYNQRHVLVNDAIISSCD